MRAVVSLLVALPLVAAATDKPPKAKVDGFWDSPAGRLQLLTNGNRVAGRLVSANDGVQVKVGEKLLDGTLDEDNLTADVRVGVVAPKCGNAGGNAFLVLLVTKSGKLTGGVSTKASCASDVSSVTMLRSKEGEAATGGPSFGTILPGRDDYDANGKRKQSAEFGENVKALMADGKEYINEGQFEKAREQFLKALARDSKIGEIYNGIGATYAVRSDYASAVDWYKKGLEAAPGFGDLYYNLACAYAQQDKPALALRYLKLAAAKGYAEGPTMDEDHDLDPIRNEKEFPEIRRMMQGGSGSDAPAAPGTP